VAEGLRLLVGYEIGLDVLVPLVLALLEREPLLEGDFFFGDVLAVMTRVSRSYWSAHPALRVRLEKITASVGDPDDGAQGRRRGVSHRK
jgi:hypothetical protein